MINCPWIDYWKRDNFWRDSQLWKRNAEIFIQRASRIIGGFSKRDTILNIGCGAGHTEFLLAPYVKSIYAMDVAEQFTEKTKWRCEGFNNVKVGLLGKDYTDLNLDNRKFSLILCVSVVQYHKNIWEIEDLIKSVKGIALPAAKLLIADLPRKRGKLGFTWDILCSGFQAMQKGYFKVLLQTTLNKKKSDYPKNIKQLYFRVRDLKTLIQRLGLNAKIIRKSVSVYANRLSLLIEF